MRIFAAFVAAAAFGICAMAEVAKCETILQQIYVCQRQQLWATVALCAVVVASRRQND